MLPMSYQAQDNIINNYNYIVSSGNDTSFILIFNITDNDPINHSFVMSYGESETIF